MRLVHNREELKPALEAAQSEAQRAFGDSEVYLEKAIVNPRHIEMQILADEHGNTLYLGERECSLQRRHQKVLEESPSPLVDPDMRRRMGEVAVRVAKAAHYSNAGTVEFLVDQQKNFYFLEMNTRLQVEHPVTELVTGLDLVHLQIRIAAGEKLPFAQQDVVIRGHAIECRIYAEDPDSNYFPSPGKIALLQEPAGPGIRLDSGIYEGWTVPIDYDPLLAKLIGYGTARPQVIARLSRALEEYFVGGIKSNLSLFQRILSDADFQAGTVDTGFLDRLLKSKRTARNADDAENCGHCGRVVCRTGFRVIVRRQWNTIRQPRKCGPQRSHIYKLEADCKNRGVEVMLYDIAIDGKSYRLELSQAEGRWQCRLDGQEFQIDVVRIGDDVLSLYQRARHTRSGANARRLTPACGLAAQVMPRKSAIPGPYAPGRESPEMRAGPRKLVASMPGKVVRVLVSEKSAVEAGQGIIVVEAMKMQNEIKSPKKGIVQKLIAAEGANVNAGDVLAIVE